MTLSPTIPTITGKNWGATYAQFSVHNIVFLYCYIATLGPIQSLHAQFVPKIFQVGVWSTGDARLTKEWANPSGKKNGRAHPDNIPPIALWWRWDNVVLGALIWGEIGLVTIAYCSFYAALFSGGWIYRRRSGEYFFGNALWGISAPLIESHKLNSPHKQK